MSDKYLTTVATTGPAVELDVCPNPLGRWLAARGMACKVIVYKVNGNELDDSDLEELVALFEAANEPDPDGQ